MVDPALWGAKDPLGLERNRMKVFVRRARRLSGKPLTRIRGNLAPGDGMRRN